MRSANMSESSTSEYKMQRSCALSLRGMGVIPRLFLRICGLASLKKA
jgi:hypothetical protein